MDSSLPKQLNPAALADAEIKISEVVEALIDGALVTPTDMFKLFNATRHLRAELETLDQVLANMAQKKTA